jgi:hypothetical protein
MILANLFILLSEQLINIFTVYNRMIVIRLIGHFFNLFGHNHHVSQYCFFVKGF